MVTVDLRKLEQRIRIMNKENADKIESFESKLNERNMKSGRVRPKNVTEKKILSRFKRK